MNADANSQPASPVTIDRFLDQSAARFPDKHAIAFKDERVSYAELKERVDRLASGLRRLGLGRGDHVAILMPNCIEWIVALYAIVRIDAVAVGINTRYKAPEVEHLLHHSDARALIVRDRFEAVQIDYLALLSQLVAFDEPWLSLPHLRHIIVDGENIPDGAVSFRELQATQAAQGASLAAVDDPALIIYTSGTTGLPKGCMLSHRALYEAAVRRPAMLNWTADDCQLSTLPFASIGGASGAILANGFIGSRQVVMDVFEPEEAMRAIAANRVSIFYGVPTMYLGILEHPRRSNYDLSSLVKGSVGSTSVPIELMRWIMDKAKGLGMNALVGYGQTEAGGVSHHTRFTDTLETRISTVGKSAAGVIDRIADPETGEACPDGEEGEICVKTPQIMSGYYKDPASTTRRIRNGWLHTGDVGVRDASGNVRVTGRMADTIIVGGFNTYPVEIENCLIQHPDIGAVSIVGVPDRRLGEVVMAFVIPKPGHAITAESVRDFAKSRLAGYKVPKHVAVVTEFPMNEAGKVEKTRQKQWAAENIPGSPN